MGITGTNREGEAQLSDIRARFGSGPGELAVVFFASASEICLSAGPPAALAASKVEPGKFHEKREVTRLSRNGAAFLLILSETPRKTGAFATPQPKCLI